MTKFLGHGASWLIWLHLSFSLSTKLLPISSHLNARVNEVKLIRTVENIRKEVFSRLERMNAYIHQ